MLILLSVAIAPGLALLSFFYLRNQMATEPRNLLHAFIYGAALTFPILFIQYVLQEEHIFTNPIIQEVLFTGMIEEFFKWFLLMLIIYNHVEFDDPYDGILYGVSLSLGFATVENILYLLSYGIDTAMMRALLPVSSHALFGVVMGFYLGKAKFSKLKTEKTWLLWSLAAPIVLHVFYNALLLLPGKLDYIVIPFMIFLWWFALRKVKRAHEHLVSILMEKSYKKSKKG